MLPSSCLVVGRLALGNGYITDEELEWALNRCSFLEEKKETADILQVLRDADRITEAQLVQLKSASEKVLKQTITSDSSLSSRLKNMAGSDVERPAPKPTQQDIFFCKVAVMNKLMKKEDANRVFREIKSGKEYQDAATIIRELRAMSNPAIEIVFKIWGAWKKKIDEEKKRLKLAIPIETPTKTAKISREYDPKEEARRAEEAIKKIILESVKSQAHLSILQLIAEKKRGSVSSARLSDNMKIKKKRVKMILEDLSVSKVVSEEGGDVFKIQADALNKHSIRLILKYAENATTNKLLQRWLIAYGEEV